MKMNKTGKTTVSLVATAALALSLAPAAFAANAGTDGEDVFNENKQATTNVKMGVNVDQIAASVPLNLTVVAKANGGDIVAPTDGSYKIVNKSPMAIHVTDMKAESLATGWKFAATAIKAGTAPTGAGNDLYFAVKGTALTGAADVQTVTGWDLAAANADNTTDELALPIAASTSQLNVSEDVAGTLFTVTYTIAPGTSA